MHIQEGTNTTLTTCTKMTEELDRRHGVNGNSNSRSPGEDAPVHNSALTGGRLKFFKDGKFILELVRGSGREGERAGWVSVSRAGAAGGTGGGGPRAASLCASDDTSSLQSSPWQRDHCWKQPVPRRHRGRARALYYCRPATLAHAHIAAAARVLRRRPLASPPAALSPPAPEPPDPDDRERYLRMKLKKPQYSKLRAYRKTGSALRPRCLNAVVQRLRERLEAAPPAPPAAPPAPAPPPAPPVHAKLASCRQEHAMVSPRKRILRELERVSLEEGAGKRRARPAAPAQPAAPPPSAPLHSSYSIHSLLGGGAAVGAAGAACSRWAGGAPLLPPPPPLWLPYAAPPWPPHLPLLTPRDDPPSDLPLNLSKH